MRYLAFLLVCLGTVSADEIKPIPDPINDPTVKPPIRIPMIPVVVEPGVIVPPVVDPKEPDLKPVPDLRFEEIYIIAHTEAVIIRHSRLGYVSLTPVPGPHTFYFSKFSDGVDRNVQENRTVKEPFLYIVRAEKSGDVELIISPADAMDDSQDVRVPLTVTVGPRPPPIPDDPPTPDPDDPPGPPIPGKENRVLIIYESSDLPKYPPAQTAVFAAASLREYLAKKCVKGPDGKTPEYRIWDKDVDTVNVSTVWKDAMKLQRQSLPWIIVSNGSTGFSGPLPTDVDSTVTLLKKYLGD